MEYFEALLGPSWRTYVFFFMKAYTWTQNGHTARGIHDAQSIRGTPTAVKDTRGRTSSSLHLLGYARH